ncbi:hypothetical protein H072_1544 [Dactylellina haptotyla CBS 200.50]|uniref:Uncharacterized protein n=1 Tax=Dactylellina haptotyla (strain CBS 200.50) TaxID=1284197 RepID=S8ANL7_DACHA|nr:hypothetical protein H072_1544 [Dactylellina haptotyla CBS 200.50]
MESIEKLDFDQHRRKHADSSESTLAGDRSATNENTDNTFLNGGAGSKHENVADYRTGGSEKALHESQADQSLSWVMLNVENLDISTQRKAVRNTESQASINPAGAQQTTQPPGDTTYRSESAFGQPPRTAGPDPVDQDGEDSDSEVDLSWGGELALERLGFHLAAWEEALEAEEWSLAVEHAAVLRTFNQLPSKDVEISARITPALRELATGYTDIAISLLNEVKDERTPLTTGAWTVALIKTDQLSAAKKWCTRLINITRERKLETHAGFYLMAEILKKQGRNAEAAFYQTKFDAQNLKLEKWMKAALEVARLDVCEPNSPQEPVHATLHQANPTSDPVDELQHENESLNRNLDKLHAENLKLEKEIQVMRSKLPENAPVLPPEEFHIDMNQHLTFSDYENSDVKTEKCGRALGLAASWPQHPDSAALVEKILWIGLATDYEYIPKDLGMPIKSDPVFNPLHLAVLKENEPVVANLLKFSGIDLNYRTIAKTNYTDCINVPVNRTALQIACLTNRSAKIVKMLLAAGANLNCGKSHEHPVNLAIRQNRSVTVENFGILKVLFQYEGNIASFLEEWQDGIFYRHEITRRHNLKLKLQKMLLAQKRVH